MVIVQNAMLQNSYYSAFGIDARECQDQIDYWSSTVPVGGTLVFAGAPLAAWFCMDKRNLIDFMGFVANAGLPNGGTSLFGGSIGGPGSIFVADDGTNETPRKGWTDDSLVKRKPPPSEKPGKNTQIGNVALPDAILSTIQVLQNLAAELLKSSDRNRRRIGGIIIYQLGLALTGVKTIGDALRFLEPYLAELS